METGRYLFQFPKLEPYTDFDLFLIDSHTGQIEMYDDDNDVTYPFNVRASRKKRNMSVGPREKVQINDPPQFWVKEFICVDGNQNYTFSH